ncbi:MAG: sigma-70 family RNA polymerase sigma factor [Xanthobacteraceae bacterium]|jgi:RNA polymerase sigma-32 factor|nr:sigma-70 family RNA polymerase sigma factor [Xanthobacteraceae bacterium]
MTTAPLIDAAKKVGFLTLEQEQDLLARAHNGDAKARDRIVLAHLPLVMAYAGKFQSYHSIDDLISCGTIGLLKAIDRYRPERANGGRFATYAAWWVRSEIGEFMLAQKSLVRVGTTAAQKTAFFNLNKAKARLGIDSANLSPGQVAALAAELKIPADVVVEMNVRLLSDLSLNVHVVNKEGTAAQDTLQDHLEDTSLVAADDMLIAAEDKTADADALADALATLKPRDRRILELRELSESPLTLEEIAQTEKVSRERVRQIQVRARERVEAHLTGKAKPKAARAKPPSKSVRQSRIAFVKANLDSMRPVEMARALGISPKTIGNYLRAVRREREALPLAA